MSLPVYVVNFDELIDDIGSSINATVDTSDLEHLLKNYFDEILKLLEKLAVGYKGTQKVKGFATKGEPICFAHESDVLITGITFSQSNFDLGGFDKWNLKLVKGTDEVNTFEDVFSKDTLQHKYFERLLPIPQGYSLTATIEKSNDIDKVYWIDVEYLEL